MKKLITAISFVICLAVSAHAADGGDREYIYGAHFSSASGISSSGQFDFTTSVINKLMEKTTYSLSIKRLPSEDDLVESLMANEIDMAMLYPYQVADLIDRGGDIYPLITYELDGDRNMAYCLFSRKEDDAAGLGAAQGKTLVRQKFNPFAYLQLRNFLFENGIDKPLWEVFSGFTVVPNSNSAMMAVVAGKADLYWTSEEITILMNYFYGTLLPKIGKLACTESVYGHLMFVVNKGTVNEPEFLELRKSIGGLMGNLREMEKIDSELKKIMSYMRLEKGGFVPSNRKQFEYETNLLHTAKERGWDTETNFIVRKLKEAGVGTEVNIKPDMGYCKQKCDDGNNECIVQCLTGE